MKFINYSANWLAVDRFAVCLMTLACFQVLIRFCEKTWVLVWTGYESVCECNCGQDESVLWVWLWAGWVSVVSVFMGRMSQCCEWIGRLHHDHEWLYTSYVHLHWILLCLHQSTCFPSSIKCLINQCVVYFSIRFLLNKGVNFSWDVNNKQCWLHSCDEIFTLT